MVSTARKKVNRHGEKPKNYACLSTSEFQNMGKWELPHPQLSMMFPITFKLVMTLYSFQNKNLATYSKKSAAQ